MITVAGMQVLSEIYGCQCNGMEWTYRINVSPGAIVSNSHWISNKAGEQKDKPKESIWSGEAHYETYRRLLEEM